MLQAMDPLIRMIDANANRAREGLRVMEDAVSYTHLTLPTNREV